MTQENKELLLKDLCARLPYGVYVQHMLTKIQGKLNNINLLHFYNNTNFVQNVEGTTEFFGEDCIDITQFKPYLRSMSSMTEEEKIESLEFAWEDDYGRLASYEENIPKYIDWLNKKMFDYRGLIEKGLALEASKGMYNIN